MFQVAVGITFFALLGWFGVSIGLLVPAVDTMELTPYALFSLRVVTWSAFGMCAVSYFTWLMAHNFVPEKKKRQSDGQWRSGVFLATSFLATLLSGLTVSFMLEDDGLSTVVVSGLRLLTPLTGYEALLCGLCFVPVLLVLGIYVLFGRSRGNNINPHAN